MTVIGRSLIRLLVRFGRMLPPGVIRWLGNAQFGGCARGALIRRLARPLRGIDVTITHGRCAGLRFNAGGTNPGYALGTTEPLVQSFLADTLRPGRIFHDVGANVGFFSMLAAREVTEEGSVYAFEPDPENVATLRRNVALNGFRNVHIRPVGLGERSGAAHLWLGSERTQGRVSSEGSAPENRWRPVPIDLTTLDEEVGSGRVAPPDVIKIDIEGGEVSALRGMQETLRAHGPIVICELHGTNEPVAELLRGMGYRLSVLEMDEAVESAPWWVHLVAVPELAEAR